MTWAMQVERVLQQALQTLGDERLGIRPPTELAKAIHQVKRRFGNGAANALRPDRVRAAVDNLLVGMPAVTRRDRFVLAHAFAQRQTALGDRSVMACPQHAQPLVGEWDEETRAGCIRGSHWRGLFHSFLQAGEDERSGVMFQRLRRLLREALPQLASRREVQPLWLEAAMRHRGLLGDDPLGRYVDELRSGETALLEDLRASVAIPGTSWFWEDLTSGYAAWLTSRKDEEFRQALPTLLRMVGELPLHRDALLVASLDRYAACADRSPHPELMALSMDAWGSPQLRQQHRWAHVKPATKQMVCGWLALEDLEDFYQLCQQDRAVDTRRLEFWLQYIDQVSFSRIALGPHLATSSDPDAKEFRRRKKGRLARLTETPRFNNAFMMQIGPWLIVVFSEVGHACYVYGAGEHEIDLSASTVSLRNLRRTSHKRRWIQRGDWESDFENSMVRLGISRDHKFVSSSAGATPSGSVEALHDAKVQNSSAPGRPPVREAARRAIEPAPPAAKQASGPLDQHIEDLIALRGWRVTRDATLQLEHDFGITVDDLRGSFGCLWLKPERPTPEIRSTLLRHGFKEKQGKGFWRK